VFAGLEDIHPPLGNKQIQVAAAFEQVFSAKQQQQTNILFWKAYEARVVPAAEANATNLISEARNVAVSKVALAEGEAARFVNQMAAYQASPSVYTRRTYLETLARALGPANKFVLTATNTQDVLTLNLEENIRGDILNKIIAPPDMNKAATNR
jgi:membrane protease subunit HflK